MKHIFLFVFIFLTLMSCEKKSQFEDYDLLQHGLAIKIKAPAEPEVQVTDLGIAKDVTVMKGESYNVQIIASTATTYKTENLISEKKKEVENGPYFSEIIFENENGFVFEKKVDEENINYDFRVIRIVGDTEYDFQTGLIGKFSKEAAMAMFEAVQ